MASRLELQAELRRLAEAIARGAELEAVLHAVRERQAELKKVEQALANMRPEKRLRRWTTLYGNDCVND